jgi:hypothetical protein
MNDAMRMRGSAMNTRHDVEFLTTPFALRACRKKQTVVGINRSAGYKEAFWRAD